MERLRHLDFELKIERQGEQYTARVLRSPAGEASGTFVLPFSEDRLEVLVLRLGRLRASTRRIHSAEEEAARELGGRLFEAVFGREVLACFRSSLARAYSREGTGLRLKLRLQEVPELADIPWEFLFDTSVDRFLAQSNRTPIVRYVELPERIRPLTVRLPLRVLVMISSPADYQRLDVGRERQLLQEALGSLIKDGKVQINFVEKATLPALQRRLRDGTYHVFHFIGHGGFDKKSEEGVLVLENEQGLGWLAAAHRIGTLLHDHPSLRLAVLNSCEGARNSRTDPFAGMAVTLVRQGVPAVVGMQFEITDEAAIAFSNEFYTALAAGFPVDAAVAEARKAIYAQPNDVEWGTPVVYMRSSDGLLFKLPQKPTVEEILPPEPKPAVTTRQPEATPQTQKPERVSPPEKTLLPIPEPVATREQREASLQTQKPERVSPPEKTAPPAPEPATSTRQSEAAPQTQPLETVAPLQPPRAARKKVAPVKSQVSLSLIRVLKGHKKQVNRVAFSPDGETLASASGGFFGGDNTVRLWRVSDGTLLKTLKEHTKMVGSVIFSPDGQTLASGSADKTVRLWRVSDGTLLKTLTGHTSSVRSVAFSPNGQALASGSTDKTVRLWRVSDGALLKTLTRHKNWVLSVAFSPDEQMLASGSWDKTVRLWRVLDGTLLTTLKEHTDIVNSVAFSPDGQMLASGSYDQTVRLWAVVK